jgi:hypothetical protein
LQWRQLRPIQCCAEGSLVTTPGGYSAGTIFLSVVPSFKDFQNAVRREAKAANKAFGEEQAKGRAAQASTDRRDAERRGKDSGGAYGRAMSNAISKALAALPKQTIDVDSSAAEAQIAVIRARLEALDGKDIKIGANSREASAVLQRLQEELKQISLGSTEAHVVVNAGTAYAELKRIDHDLNRIDGRRATAHVKVDTNAASRGLQGLLGHLDNNGASMRAFNGLVLAGAAALPLLVPAAIAAAGAIAGIGIAAGVGILGLGALIAAFSGIGTAVKALDAVHKNAAKDALANSKAIRVAAKGVRDAEQGVARARQQAADSATDAARRVADAMRRQKDAEENLRDVQKDAKKAQIDLTKARAVAQKQIEDLTLRMRGGAVAERQALVDLFEAQVAYNNAQADSGATNLDKEKASINLEQARIGIAQIRADNVALAEEQKKAAQTGVEGTDTVIQAQDQLTQSNKRVVDAQRQVADAAQAVKDAQTAQARDARDSALSVRDANERLADSQAAYTEAVTKTGDVGSASMQQLNDAMSKLGPAGRAFAIFLESTVMPFLRGIRSALQEGMLPGVTAFFKTIIGTYGPQLTAFMGTLGKVLGDLFTKLGETLKSPAFRGFFDMLATQGPVMLKLWGDIGLNLLTIFAQLATALAPLATDMLKFLARVTKQFSDFLATPQGKKAMSDFLHLVEKVGPQVMTFFTALVKAVWNLGTALGPYALVLLKVFTGFLTFIAGMDPTVLGGIVIGIIAITFAIQALLAISSVIGTVAIAVEVAGAPVLGVIAAVILIIAALAVAFVLLWTHSETFRDIVTSSFKVIGAVIGWVWNNLLKPVLKALWAYVKFVGEVWFAVFDLMWHIFKAALGKVADAWHWFAETGVGKAIIGFFRDYVQPAWQVFADWVADFWGDIQNLFKKGVVFVVDTVINGGLIDGFNWLADKFGSKKIGRIQLPATMYSDSNSKTAPKKATKFGLATGGFVPGFSPTPTADNIPAMLTAGEFVLPVRAVQTLRAQFGDGFLEMLRRGLPGYANGGLVDFGRLLQSKGFRVSEQSHFGGVHPVHAKNSLHYKDQAIDVNYGPGGQSPEEKKAIDAIIGLAKAYGLRTIWQAPGHYDHAHFDTGKGGSILGKVGGWLKDKAGSVINAPLEWLRKKVRGLYGHLNDNMFGEVLIGGTEKLINMGVHKLVDVGSAIGDFFTSDDDAKPGYANGGEVKLYDNGGWLQPGLTTVLNASGRPEPVFSAQQWESMNRNGGAGGVTVNGGIHGGDTHDVLSELEFRLRAARRGGVYAERVG